MLITEKDVGRKVRLRNGKEFFIVNFHGGAYYPVHVSNGSYYGADGFYNDVNNPTVIDIVQFVEGHSTVELPSEDDDFEDNGQFIQKVPSAESNAKRFLNMLKAQGVYELVVVTDIGEVRCKLNRDRQGED